MSGEHDQESEVMEHLTALGYIDPGAGSSMWQLVLAGLLNIWMRITSIFRKKRDSDDDE